MIAEQGKGMVIGSKLPFFDLPGVGGENVSSGEFEDKLALVIIFTCNHCPYAKAYQERIKALQEKFGERGTQVIAINSNDSVNYPDDGFEQMKERAKEKQFNFPYLYDESQEIAKTFGAQVTPDCFVFDENKKLVYRGRIDDNWENENAVTSKDLENAIEQTLDGKEVKVKEERAIGCSIKWKFS